MGFRARRDELGLRQDWVADKLGITPSALSMWERGKAIPRALMLIKIAKLYQCTPEELLEGNPQKAS